MENLTDNYKGWDKPQRQSAGAIFIMFLKTAVVLIKSFWPLLIILVLRKKGDESSGNYFLLIIILFISLTFIVTLIEFWFFKFHIKQHNLIIQSGWLKKRTITIPVQYIQEVHLEQNLLQRLLKVVSVNINSAGSQKVEANIDALPYKKAEELKVLLLSQSHVGTGQAIEEIIPKKMITSLGTADLMRFSLSTNHLETFVIISALSLNLIDDLKEAFNIDSWGLMRSYADKAAGETTLVVSILVIAGALISVVASVIRTVIKFYNFTIEQIQHGWKISFGLINRQQKIIPSNKIQVLTWKANWIRRKLNLWIIHVQSIGYSITKRKQLIQIPVTSLDQVLSLIPVYQLTPVFETNKGQRIEPAYWKRKLLFTATPVTLILVLIIYLWIGVAAIGVLLLFFYLAWYFNKWYKVFRWQINDEGIQLFSGVWGRKYSLLTWKKIQQVAVTQNPYQRTHQLANCIFFSVGGRVELPYIQLSTANYLANLSLYYVESRDEHWM
ncbi:MAG: PH domain-containing protein [Chitinophagaceae bacterium]|nr:PH domain-containing protein [Chitinophagaceae bacterium]